MKYFSTILLLLYCLPLLAQEPRGREWLPQVQADDVSNLALTTEVVTPITVRPGEAPMKPTEQRLILHSRPVWQAGDDGQLAPVSTAVEGGIESLKAVWRADANTVRFRVTEDGVCIYRAGQHVLRVRPMKMQAEATDGSALADADQVKPTATTAQSDRVVQVGSFSGVRFEHIVEPGSIKEIAWLDAAPAGIATARWFVVGYRWDSATLTPSITSGAVRWKTSDGKTVLVWPAPVVTDATGKELRANYRIRVATPNVIGLLVNATDLRAATYPVGIDPTTTTALGDSLMGRSSRRGTPDLLYRGAYLKFTMPTMSGNTVTNASLAIVASVHAGPLGNIDVYARAVADTGAYNSSSTNTTLDALALGTAVSTGNTFAAGTGSKTVNLFGDSSKGVSKFYADYPGGGELCVAMLWTGFTGSTNGGNASLKLGDEDILTPFIEFVAYNHATNYPRITITYTAGGGSSAGSFFFGSN